MGIRRNRDGTMRTRIVIGMCIITAGVLLGIILLERGGLGEQGEVEVTPSVEEESPAITPSVEEPSGTAGILADGAPLSAEDITITIIYDNNPYDSRLKTEWGFSCLIRGAEKTILFDTGGIGSVLLSNMQQLDVTPEEIDIVVLSHEHGDHTEGLPDFLDQNNSVTVYAPQSFPYYLKESITTHGADMILVSEPVRICENVYSTGEMGTLIKEQALIIRTDRGLIVITGCAHPGVVRIVQRAKDLLEDDVLFVMGGFHLSGEGRNTIAGIVASFRELGVRYAAPCHCSGELARQLFEEEYGQNYIEVGVGAVIYVKDLI